VFGDEVVCLSVSYSRSDPGYPGMALHTDSHPYGSNILGLRGSSPILVRALIYLDDLTEDRAPLRVVPSSHLSLHADAIPYRRYAWHPAEIALTCRAGDAILMNQRLFHAAGANRSRTSRALLAISYRPAWAGPPVPGPEYEPELLDRLPPSARARFADQNRRLADTTIVNWSPELPVGGTGLSPARWLDGRGRER
jgi:Phytanoyl-CoA dioxygenase (PhyH)